MYFSMDYDGLTYYIETFLYMMRCVNCEHRLVVYSSSIEIIIIMQENNKCFNFISLYVTFHLSLPHFSTHTSTITSPCISDYFSFSFSVLPLSAYININNIFNSSSDSTLTAYSCTHNKYE